MQEHVEGRRRDAHFLRDVFARLLLEDAQADGARIAFVDGGERGLDLLPRRDRIALIADALLDRRLAVGGVDLAREIVFFEEHDALPGAELIERDAERDGAEPGIEPDVLPDELPDVRDDLRVGLGKRFLGRRLGAETGEEHAAVEPLAVLAEELAERLAIARLRLLDEDAVDLVGLPPEVCCERRVRHRPQDRAERAHLAQLFPVSEGHDSCAHEGRTGFGLPPYIEILRRIWAKTTPMTKRTLAALAALVGIGAPAVASADVAIPATKTTLANGATVIFHEEHTIPTVVVDVSYNVGSRFEQDKRTGFAHLFEHLMFMGTNRAPTKKYDEWMEAVGGSNNAWTSQDRTNYYDLGPPTSLKLLLWLEADRLRDLGPVMTKDKLDAQRDVVRNERRQTSENTPYGKVELELPALLYPEGHPYHHPVIGSHEDLESASVDDVKAFFAKNYDPANATIVVAGDFDPAKAKADIDKFFGTIPSRGAPTDPGAPGFSDQKTTLTKVVRKDIEDDVELSKVLIAYQSPKHFGAGDAELDLLSTALGSGKASRLYKTLVYDLKLAQSVNVSQESGTLGSEFLIDVIARPGVDLAKLEAAVDKEVAAVRKTALTDDELLRAKNLVETGFVARLESVHARASLLAMYQAEVKDPAYAQKDLDRYRNATKETIRAAAEKFLLPDARVILHVIPKKKTAEKK